MSLEPNKKQNAQVTQPKFNRNTAARTIKIKIKNFI